MKVVLAIATQEGFKEVDDQMETETMVSNKWQVECTMISKQWYRTMVSNNGSHFGSRLKCKSHGVLRLTLHALGSHDGL